MVALAAAGWWATLPGAHRALPRHEPLLADLRISRVDYAQLNLWASLIGSAFAIGIGRIVDWLGTRVVLTTVALALGVVVVVRAHATGYLGPRDRRHADARLGQSALSVIKHCHGRALVSRAASTAMATYSIALSIGFMVAFPAVGAHGAVLGMARSVAGRWPGAGGGLAAAQLAVRASRS